MTHKQTYTSTYPNTGPNIHQYIPKYSDPGFIKSLINANRFTAATDTNWRLLQFVFIAPNNIKMLLEI